MIRNGPRTRLRSAPGRRMTSTSSLPTRASRRRIVVVSALIEMPRDRRQRGGVRLGRFGAMACSGGRHSASSASGTGCRSAEVRLTLAFRLFRRPLSSFGARPSPSASSAAARACSSRWTRAANTSSNDGRSSRALTTSPPRAPTASTTSGMAVPASSTTTVSCREPSWRTCRTNGRPVELLRHRSGPPSRPRRRRPRRPRGAGRRAWQAPAGGRSRSSATMSHDSASLTYWVVTIIVRPSARRRWSSSQTLARRSGSMPAVGSSRNSSAGIVHERARQLETSLHATGELAGMALRGRPRGRPASGPPWSAAAAR